MTADRSTWARTSALALGLLTMAGAADASVMSTTANAALSATPVTFSFGGGAASFSFTATTITGVGPGAAVATGGTGTVSTLFGGITDFSSGAQIDNTGLFTFAAYPTASPIPDSPADDFIGLAFQLSDGQHFGYAEVDGASLVGYGYESTPATTILAGAASVPEPASFAVLAAGVVGLVAYRGGRARRPA